MSTVHSINMTHESADKIIDALRDCEERLGDEAAGALADHLLSEFDAQHRAEATV